MRSRESWPIQVTPHVRYIYAWATGNLRPALELYAEEGIAGFKRLFPLSTKVGCVTLWREEREVVVADYHLRPWTVCPTGRPYEEE